MAGGSRQVVPARRVLQAANAANEQLGHENLGFLSESHGFMPRRRPLPSLPSTHRLWDEVAAQLPELWRTMTLRPVLDAMAVLGAGPEDLADPFLLRASTIVSIFAHAYHYVDPQPPAALPASILQPWAQIGRRLQRPRPHLSFSDLNIYNWKLRDPHRPDPMRVDNLELLVPIVGNEDERRFQSTPIEIVAQFTPALGAVVRAQEAVVADDAGALADELLAIGDTLRGLTYDSFMKVDPNPSSGGNYVNPVVWGKTVAPLATPYQPESDGIPGPSGTAIPAFQLLDIFFGRQSRATTIGRETDHARQWFPPHWREFLAAAEAVDVPAYVRAKGDTMLRGLLEETLDGYAGDAGLLGRHRLKTYGFLDLSFKAGRTKTLGGFGGGFGDRLWDRMDGELDLARRERYTGHPSSCQYARVQRVEIAGGEGTEVRHITLDVTGCGIRYETGSRCAVLPENSPELVERTLRAVRARGDEPVLLDAVWQDAVRLRDGHEHARVLPLELLLTFGRIRPVTRPVAKSLYAMTQHALLRDIIEARAEDQWELWQVLELLAADGFNPRGLWKAHPGDREGICRIVVPESFRMYSISSAKESASMATEIHLTVGALRYDTTSSAVSQAGTREGTGSTFLCSLLPLPPESQGRRVSIKIVQPPRFRLPEDSSRPIVMVAGGTGLAPFRSLLRARARQVPAGENWLFLGVAGERDVYYADELHTLEQAGALRLHVACSGSGRHVADDMLEEPTAAELWRLLGEGAYVYVCGRTGFASSAMASLTAILDRSGPGAAGLARLARLAGEGRLMQEIYTTYAGPHCDQRVIDASEVVSHNNDDDGYWLIIDGRVYDVTGFSALHPGGSKIIRSYAGMDATDAYRRARHDVNPEVHAMLPMYEIGAVRRLDFASMWTVALAPGGLRVVTLKDLYRGWLGLLYRTVEMENALANDYGVRHEPVTHDESAGHLALSPYKARLLLATHERFLRDYLADVTGERLCDLWAVTAAFEHECHRGAWMADQVGAIRGDHAARALGERERRTLATLGRPGPDVWTGAVDGIRHLEEADRWFLREMKLGLRRGVKVLERWEWETTAVAAHELVEAAKALPEVLREYYVRASS